MTHYIIASVDLQRFWMPTLQKWVKDQGLTPLYWTSDRAHHAAERDGLLEYTVVERKGRP